eukprot:TRINITY_DN46476_c0_g1_i1.p2 TRINITY_DN46476_c0_g1~~TRINITY_DN46476_c0_g1_i1.p2  ORF type:complete len:331 (+),score=70.18 TRINITY_DN46476_c0_g1_i1:114-995(+)
MGADEGIAAAAAKVAAALPPGAVRVCILGGTRFSQPSSELIVQEIARRFVAELGDSVVVLTGGMPGVQETFARSLGSGSTLFNLLPAGQTSSYGSEGVGRDMEAGASLEERMDIFGQLGDIYLTCEGGPGVAKEARAAFARGAAVVPLISTGGASGGMFDFPAGALEQPRFATEAQWECLRRSSDPNEVAGATLPMLRSLVASLTASSRGPAVLTPSSVDRILAKFQQYSVARDGALAADELKMILKAVYLKPASGVGPDGELDGLLRAFSSEAGCTDKPINVRGFLEWVWSQ